MAEISVLISLAEEASLDEVASACEAAGLRVTSRLETLRVLTGAIDSTRVALLAEVPGVRHVEKDQTVRAY